MTPEELAAKAAEEEAAAAAAAGNDDDRGDDFTPTPDEPIELGGEFDVDLLKQIAGDDSDSGGEGGKTNERDGFIPRARFDEVNDKAKRLEEELRQAREGKGGEPTTSGTTAGDNAGDQSGEDVVAVKMAELKELQKKAKAAEYEGEDETAEALNEQIEELRISIAEEKAVVRMRAERQQAEAQASMASVVTDAYEKYPFLDIKSDAKDMDAITAVFNRRVELEQAGKSPAAALKQAVEEKGPKFAKILGVETPAGDTSVADKVRQERAERAQKQAANASVTQPAAVPGSERESSFKVDMNKISDADYEKLPESVKAKLRGDSV